MLQLILKLNYRSISLIAFFFLSLNCSAQLTDLARIDFTFIPNKNSDVEYTRFRALANYPIKLKKEGEYFIVGVDYSNIHLRFKDENLPFDKEELNDFQLFDLVFGYLRSLKNDWRLGLRFKPGISTNKTASDLT